MIGCWKRIPVVIAGFLAVICVVVGIVIMVIADFTTTATITAITIFSFDMRLLLQTMSGS